MKLTPVKQPQLVKIALLLSVLVSIPKGIFIYNMIDAGNLDFSKVILGDFLYRFIAFFLFSWLILQLNTNWGYSLVKLNRILRTGVLIAINILITWATLHLFRIVYPLVVEETFSRQDGSLLAFTYGILLMVLFFIARILRLQTERQESMVENERLKQENLKNEIAALKNQIDPHFLFNSLNSLTSLVRDNEPATKFVKKLSFMYRYILQSGDCNFVTIRDELKFLESYTYLIETRYRNRFTINIAIEDKYFEERIPPLALQVLVENAVKHNEISQNNPLKVNIFSQDGALHVENYLRPRLTLAEGTGNGLLNLEKRYLLLMNKNIEVNKDQGIFSVKLPLKK